MEGYSQKTNKLKKGSTAKDSKSNPDLNQWESKLQKSFKEISSRSSRDLTGLTKADLLSSGWELGAKKGKKEKSLGVLCR